MINFKSAWKVNPTEKSIEQLWEETETDTVTQSNWIQTYFGDINIYRNNLTIEIYSLQKYGNFRYNEAAISAINICRIIAKKLHQNKVIFCPDSSYPTSDVYSYALNGLEPNEIIKRGVEKFGPIPKGISKGRKNYFFVDYINEPIGDLLDWDKEKTYWVWDDEFSKYKQVES